ncbi:MAG: hypothetical protein AAB426_06165 [Myxococcota bacterium]
MRILRQRNKTLDALQRRQNRARVLKRDEQRTEVDWLAWTTLGGIRLGGRLRDVSSSGAFFEPRSDLSEPGLLESLAKRPLIERDDAVILSYETTFEDPVQVVATVRWLGPSKEHDCYGLGMKFSAE